MRLPVPGLVSAIRAAGAAQPVMVSGHADRMPLVSDSNVIYEVSPPLAAMRTEVQRDAQFGLLASRVPVSANDWDPKLDDREACSAIPSDPAAVSELVEANLQYFDAHQISWTVSMFEPGKLIKDFSFHEGTTLENGWTCGHPVYPYAGLGRLVEAHLRATGERELFVVSASGSVVLAPGGFALSYGPVMAEQDSVARGPLRGKLGGLSLQVTDSAGVTRPAGILWASAGWGQ